MKSYRVGPLDESAVMDGYRSWLSKPSGKKNEWRVEKEYGSADALVREIVTEVRERRLSFRPIHRYMHYEASARKYRTIGVESVKQQVVDHAVCVALEPLIDAKVGFYQVAAVKGKGQRLCRGAVRRWSREKGYYVKLDVRKCYPSTRHDVVMRILKKYVRDGADVLYAAQALMETYGEGLEIGSYFSLRMMLLVLSFAYHHVEGLRKERRGKSAPLVSHQIWHLDDCLMASRDKRDLKMAVRSLVRYMADELGLSIKPWKVARISKAERLDIGGWKGLNGVCTLRSETFLRATRSFSRFKRHPSLALARKCSSYWGWLVHGSCDGAVRKRGIGPTFAHARSVVSRHERLRRKHERTEQAAG